MSTYHYDSNFALGVNFYNLGEAECFSYVFNELGLKLNQVSFDRLKMFEKRAEKRALTNLAQKPKIFLERASKQKQNVTQSKSRLQYVYRGPKEQRDFENSQQAEIDQQKTKKRKRKS